MTQASSCVQCNAIEPIVLYQIMQRALEPRLSTLMRPLVAVLLKPSGQGEQTSQAKIASGAASRHAETATSNLYQADANHRDPSSGSLNCNLAPKPMLVS